MIIDFFIHPEHPILAGYHKTRGYEEYIEHLRQVQSKSEFPVLISGHQSGRFESLFPLERRIESASYYVYETPVDNGEVKPADWQKFIEIVVIGNQYKVHGSFFGQCTEGFMVQLFAYLKRHEHWHDWLAFPDKDQEKMQDKLRIKHEKAGDFKDCGVKYGIVLALDKHTRIQRPPLLKFLSNNIYGNVTYQLMDENTVIHYM